MITSGAGVGWRNQLLLVNHRTDAGSFSISHFTFFIGHFLILFRGDSCYFVDRLFS